LFDPAPEEFTNRKGTRFVRFNKNEAIVRAADRPAKIEDMTEDQLAEALRAVTSVRGVMFIQDEPAYELARAIKEERIIDGKPGGGEPFEGVKGKSEGNADGIRQVQQRSVIGTDNRVPTGHSYPWRAHMALARDSDFDNWEDGGCSATLIGPSTAVSRAACYYDFDQGGFPAFAWAPGADKDSGTTFPYGWWYGCYIAYIPSAFVTGPYDTWLQWDFAAVEYDEPTACSLTPGSTVGWLG